MKPDGRVNNGGARIGGGRKPGIKNGMSPHRAHLEHRAFITGNAPLDVFIKKMSWWCRKAERLEREGKGEGLDRVYPIVVEAGIDHAYDKACEAAAEAAPYIHPKLSAHAIAAAGDQPDELQKTFVMLLAAFETKAQTKVIEAKPELVK